MLVTLLLVTLAQGGLPPNPDALPPPLDPRMILTAPPPEQVWYEDWLAVPRAGRPAAFTKLRPPVQSRIVQEGIRRILKGAGGFKLSVDESRALADLGNAAAFGFAGDAKWREPFRRAVEHVRTLLPKEKLAVIDELVPALR